jgi:hypothetical protein
MRGKAPRIFSQKQRQPPNRPRRSGYGFCFDFATRSGACCAVDLLPEYEGLGPEYIYEAEGFVLKRI